MLAKLSMKSSLIHTGQKILMNLFCCFGNLTNVTIMDF